MSDASQQRALNQSDRTPVISRLSFWCPSPLSPAEAPAWYSSNNSKHASEEDTGEGEPERDARWPGRGRLSLPLTRSVFTRARCSPLEEDSLLDAILSYCLEINIWGWVENDHISPKTQKRNQLETAILILLIDKCKERQDLQLSMNLINFFVFFKTPPKVKKEDPLKIPFKSLEARMKWDSRPKQKQDTRHTTRYAILINKTNRHNSLVARVPASSSVKGGVRYIFGATILTNFITVYLYAKKDRLQMHKHNLHVVTRISS